MRVAFVSKHAPLPPKIPRARAKPTVLPPLSPWPSSVLKHALVPPSNPEKPSAKAAFLATPVPLLSPPLSPLQLRVLKHAPLLPNVPGVQSTLRALKGNKPCANNFGPTVTTVSFLSALVHALLHAKMFRDPKRPRMWGRPTQTWCLCPAKRLHSARKPWRTAGAFRLASHVRHVCLLRPQLRPQGELCGNATPLL
jgi:hypothetical protein